MKPLNLMNFALSVKMLFTGYLLVVAIGYAMALVQILFTHGMADGKFGLSIEDIVYSYYGNRSGSMLESKLNGSMKANAPESERFKIVQWVRDGAGEKQYEGEVKEIFQARCNVCHNANAGGSIPDFNLFEEIKKRSESDQGATFASLTRVSHIHLFGIAFIFMFVGLIFSFSTGVPVRFKSIAIAMPYLFLLMDIASWWLTKLNPHFAWLVIVGGAGLAVAFVFMWIVSIYEMWALPRKISLDRRHAWVRP
ncbi:MAG TPA: elongation factor-1 alpha [Methylococcaceae bacterium]|nr:elongation factor-1 alpha [Methylococcaceae bacterium]